MFRLVLVVRSGQLDPELRLNQVQQLVQVVLQLQWVLEAPMIPGVQGILVGQTLR